MRVLTLFLTSCPLLFLLGLYFIWHTLIFYTTDEVVSRASGVAYLKCKGDKTLSFVQIGYWESDCVTDGTNFVEIVKLDSANDTQRFLLGQYYLIVTRGINGYQTNITYRLRIWPYWKVTAVEYRDLSFEIDFGLVNKWQRCNGRCIIIENDNEKLYVNHSTTFYTEANETLNIKHVFNDSSVNVSKVFTVGNEAVLLNGTQTSTYHNETVENDVKQIRHVVNISQVYDNVVPVFVEKDSIVPEVSNKSHRVYVSPRGISKMLLKRARELCPKGCSSNFSVSVPRVHDFLGKFNEILGHLTCSFLVYGVTNDSKSSYENGYYRVVTDTIDTGNGIAVLRENCDKQVFITSHPAGEIINDLEVRRLDYDFQQLYDYGRYGKIYLTKLFHTHGSGLKIKGLRDFSCNASNLNEFVCEKMLNNISCDLFSLSNNVSTKVLSIRAFSDYMILLNKINNNYGTHLIRCGKENDTYAYYQNLLKYDLLFEIFIASVHNCLFRNIVSKSNAKELNEYLNIGFEKNCGNGWVSLNYVETIVFEHVYLKPLKFLMYFVMVLCYITFNYNNRNMKYHCLNMLLVLVRVLNLQFPYLWFVCYTIYLLLGLMHMHLNSVSKESDAYVKFNLLFCSFVQYLFFADDYMYLAVDLAFRVLFYTLYLRYIEYQRRLIKYSFDHIIDNVEYKAALELKIILNENVENQKVLEDLLKSSGNYNDFIDMYDLREIVKREHGNLLSMTNTYKNLLISRHYLKTIAGMYYSGTTSGFRYIRLIKLDPREPDEYVAYSLTKDLVREELSRVIAKANKPENQEGMLRKFLDKLGPKRKLENRTTLNSNTRMNFVAPYINRVMRITSSTKFSVQNGYGFVMKTGVLGIPRHVIDSKKTEDEYELLHNTLSRMDSTFVIQAVNRDNISFEITGIEEYKRGQEVWFFLGKSTIDCIEVQTSTASGFCAMIEIRDNGQPDECHGISDGRGYHNVNTRSGSSGGVLFNEYGMLGFHNATLCKESYNEIFCKEFIINRTDFINVYVPPNGFSTIKNAPTDCNIDEIPERRLDMDFQAAVFLRYGYQRTFGFITWQNDREQRNFVSDWYTVCRYFETNSQIVVDKVDDALLRIIQAARGYGIIIDMQELQIIVKILYNEIKNGDFKKAEKLEEIEGSRVGLPRMILVFQDFIGLDDIARALKDYENKFPHTYTVSRRLESSLSTAGNLYQLGVIASFLNSLSSQHSRDSTYVALMTMLKEIESTQNFSKYDDLRKRTLAFATSLWPVIMVDRVVEWANDPEYIAKEDARRRISDFLSTQQDLSKYLKDIEPVFKLESKSRVLNINEALMAYITDNECCDVLRLSVMCMRSALIAQLLSIAGGSPDRIESLVEYCSGRINNRLESLTSTKDNGVSLLAEYVAGLKKVHKLDEEIKRYETTIADFDDMLEYLTTLEYDSDVDIRHLVKLLTKNRNKQLMNDSTDLARNKKLMNAKKQGVGYKLQQDIHTRELELNLNKSLARVVKALIEIHRMNYRGLGELGVMDVLIEIYGRDKIHTLLDVSKGCTYNVTLNEEDNGHYLTGVVLTSVVIKVKTNKGVAWVMDEFITYEDPSSFKYGERIYHFTKPFRVYPISDGYGVVRLLNIPLVPGRINDDLLIEYEDLKYTVISMDGKTSRLEIIERLHSNGFYDINHNVTIMPAHYGQVETQLTYTSSYGFCKEGTMHLPCHTLNCDVKHVHNGYACYWSFYSQLRSHMTNCAGPYVGKNAGSAEQMWPMVNRRGVAHRCKIEVGECPMRKSDSNHRMCTPDCYIMFYSTNNCCAYCKHVTIIDGTIVRSCNCGGYMGPKCTGPCVRALCDKVHDENKVEVFVSAAGLSKQQRIVPRNGTLSIDGKVVMRDTYSLGYQNVVFKGKDYWYDPKVLSPNLAQVYVQKLANDVKEEKIQSKVETQQSDHLEQLVKKFVGKHAAKSSTESEKSSTNMLHVISKLDHKIDELKQQMLSKTEGERLDKRENVRSVKPKSYDNFDLKTFRDEFHKRVTEVLDRSGIQVENRHYMVESFLDEFIDKMDEQHERLTGGCETLFSEASWSRYLESKKSLKDTIICKTHINEPIKNVLLHHAEHGCRAFIYNDVEYEDFRILQLALMTLSNEENLKTLEILGDKLQPIIELSNAARKSKNLNL